MKGVFRLTFGTLHRRPSSPSVFVACIRFDLEGGQPDLLKTTLRIWTR